MIIYYIILFLFLFFSFLDISLKNRDKLFFIFLTLFFLSYFWGLRYKIGVDWLFYIEEYNQESHKLSIEYGYKIFSNLFNYLGFDYFLFQLFITLFFLITISYFYKKYTKYRIFCILSLFLFNFIFYIEALRQIIALTLVIISYIYILKNKNIKSYIFVILSSFFHISSIVIIVSSSLFLLKSSKVYKILKNTILVFLILNILGVYPIDLFLFLLKKQITIPFIDKVYWYTQSKNSIITISFIIKLITILFFFKKTKNIKRSSIIIFIKYNLLFLLLINVSIGMYGTISTRLEVYYIPIFILALSYIIILTENILSKYILLFIFVSYFSISFIKVTKIDYFKEHYTPYNNYLMIEENDMSNLRENSVKKFWKEKKDE
ncbi:EpsG family protein [Proteus mirabilis]|uniref:EpsG family protein n=1 Tax=Proteus mirabilis TaxID=584 RepID=UPI0016277CA8|nr:EpsG family protein [Proteus mirabilis]ELA7739840.1 EpsG family protein [Proteus mirabilis]MBS3834696.1 EpsG family protein [Proteus mirabilis]MBS3866606.1 EpsG family protein [Proteus mirabilis]MBS3869901.1 EpsG family protein [Proteus mirabilis]MCL8526869.1 EpsG family protein [Proteus mirabilis]